MKIKISEATERQLDRLVAQCEGVDEATHKKYWFASDRLQHYSTDWSQAGPIIEREGIGTYKLNGAWSAHCPVNGGKIHACMEMQPTPLIAAMRCYVASKLGDEVDVPEGLV